MTGFQHNGGAASGENFEHFFEQSLNGFAIANPQGIIARTNTRLSNWVGVPAGELRGKRFSDLLTIAGRIYYETHLWPLLRIQGFFDEVLVELDHPSGQRLRVLVNGLECRDENNNPEVIYYTVAKATERLQYEQNLQYAKTVAEKELLAERENVLLREQLIAVLGHDLRNPLGAIGMVADILRQTSADEKNTELLAMLKRSSHRMTELVDNIMDFARTRLGEGIVINRQYTKLEPALHQVVNELRLIYPKKVIIEEFDIAEPVYCDHSRIAQLLSNLLANALTHGRQDAPVVVRAFHGNGLLKIAVCNSGAKIPEELQQRIFVPFTREGNRPSNNGLGLGLYISSEIARAHNATLTCTSTTEETCFTFEMPD